MQKRTVFALSSLLIIGMASLAKSESISQSFDLALQKAKEYCRRLDKAALDFVCLEQVEEAVNKNKSPQAAPTISPLPELLRGGWRARSPKLNDFSTAVYLYDYQLVRKAGDIKEHRDLIEKDGRKVRKTDASMETKHFKFRDILFGPSILLGADSQPKYNYSLDKEEELRGDSIAMVRCEPISLQAQRLLAGKAWVRLKDGAILRIDWDPESFGSYDEVWAVADRLGMKPKLRSFTEFGIEKNGVLFPTLDFTEEAYAKGGNDIFIRSTTTVKYKNYKFFTVETRIDI